MTAVPQIRPVSDLCDRLPEISRLVHERPEPVFLTRDGRGDMVLMSIEAYETDAFEREIYEKLLEAEREAETTTKRYSHEEVMAEMQAKIDGWQREKVQTS